jgi:YfiH family protein
MEFGENPGMNPSLATIESDGVTVLTDPEALEKWGVIVAFSDRRGGISEPPFDSLNLSTRQPDPADVRVNRKRFAIAAGLDPDAFVLGHQVHGTTVVEVDARGRSTRACDALITRRPGVAVGVLTADCVPILILGSGAVAAVHAGWRGLSNGVIEAALDGLGKGVAAWIGPAIRSRCYEVGDDVVSAFHDAGLPVTDDHHVDPPTAAAAALRRAGVSRIADSGLCTACDDRFYSYRRDGLTGRQGGFIALV